MAVRVTVPLAAAVKSSDAFQVPARQVTVAEASPERTTFSPVSEHVPDTAKAVRVVGPMRDPAAGPVMATTGVPVSFVKLRELAVAAFPAASERFAISVTVPSAAAEKSRLADQAPVVQVAEPLAEPEKFTVRPFSEHVPDTAKAATFAEFR